METKTKIIISKEIVINLKLVLLALIITFIAFIVFYFDLKPNKHEIQNRITIEQERIADSIAKATILADSISKLANLQLLYNEVSKKYNIGTFYEFSKKMEIPEKRKILFDECNKSLGLGFKDFKEFEYLCGFKEYDYKIIDLKKVSKDNIKDFYKTDVDKKAFPTEAEFRKFISYDKNAKEYFNSDVDKSMFPTEKEFIDFLGLNNKEISNKELEKLLGPPDNKIIYLKQILKKYIDTWNSGKYKSIDELNNKFPELAQNFDKKALGEYIETWNTGKYINLEEMDSKFPDFFGYKKKTFIVNKDTYDIPINEMKGFLKEFPKAIQIDNDNKLSFKNLSSLTDKDYENQINIFRKEIKSKTLLTFIISLIVLIFGRYLYKLTKIAIHYISMLAKAIKKYSKMDINQ